MMKLDATRLISEFFETTSEDPRISPVHISLYLALLHLWIKQNNDKPLEFYSREIMPVAKISGIATYHKALKDLQDFGFIGYTSSFNHHRGSLMWFNKILPSSPDQNNEKIFIKPKCN